MDTQLVKNSKEITGTRQESFKPTFHREYLPNGCPQLVPDQLLPDVDIEELASAQKRKEQFVTTKELAETLDVDVKTVNNTVNRLLESTSLKLSDIKMASNGGRPTKLFNEEQATLIKQEIQKHHNLTSRQIDSVSTDMEMEILTQKVLAYHIQKANEYKQRAELAELKQREAEQQVIELTPDAESWRAVQDADGTFAMTKIANTIGFKAKDGFDWFAEHDYIARERADSHKTGKWLATDKGLKSGYVRNVIWVDKVNNRSGLSVKLTADGVSKLVQLIKDGVISKK